MKKNMFFAIVGCMSLLMCACNNENAAVKSVIESQVEAANFEETETTAFESEITSESTADLPRSSGEALSGLQAKPETKLQNELQTESGTQEIDVDLTYMSTTMVYAEVYNIMTNPEEYLGKSIKMDGPYYSYFWDITGKYYHYVIIEDALACCTQGIEFIWDDNTHVFPDAYPDDYTPVEIVGTFDSYVEEDMTYYYLAAKDLTVK